jgi:hypothetical protein
VTLVRSIPLRKLFLVPLVAGLILAVCTASSAQDRRAQDDNKKSSGKSAQTATEQKPFGDEISGMYTFLREGEFVQVTVEDGTVSGFVSRYGDRESDKDAFLDQFFSKASLDGKNLAFTTKPVHGTWYEFSGVVARGEAKMPDKEGYWVIQGTLKQNEEDENKRVSAKSREVTFKSFPQESDQDQTPK